MKILSPRITAYSRTKGQSMVAGAAYRAGEKIKQDELGKIHDYRHRTPDIVHAEIVSPDGLSVPEWANARSTLWNEAETAETRANGCLGRETMLPLPHELTDDQRVSLVRSYAQWIADRQQVMVDFAVHRPCKEGDQRNHHAHILMSARQITEDGFNSKKSFKDENGRTVRFIPFDESKLLGSQEVEAFRQAAQNFTNDALADAGSAERVDCRSYKRQELEQKPTVHMGKNATKLERKGVQTERGQYNRSVKFLNRAIASAQAHYHSFKQKSGKAIKSLYEDMFQHDMFEKLRIDAYNAKINKKEEHQEQSNVQRI